MKNEDREREKKIKTMPKMTRVLNGIEIFSLKTTRRPIKARKKKNERERDERKKTTQTECIANADTK